MRLVGQPDLEPLVQAQLLSPVCGCKHGHGVAQANDEVTSGQGG